MDSEVHKSMTNKLKSKALHSLVKLPFARYEDKKMEHAKEKW